MTNGDALVFMLFLGVLLGGALVYLLEERQ